jgi:mRNA interferase RelE/StbE
VKTGFRASFAKDLGAIKDKRVLKQVQAVIQRVEQVQALSEVANVKKLRGTGNHFRIRLGEYRVGLAVSGDTVTFVRCLPRKDVYRYIP